MKKRNLISNSIWCFFCEDVGGYPSSFSFSRGCNFRESLSRWGPEFWPVATEGADLAFQFLVATGMRRDFYFRVLISWKKLKFSFNGRSYLWTCQWTQATIATGHLGTDWVQVYRAQELQLGDFGSRASWSASDICIFLKRCLWCPDFFLHWLAIYIYTQYFLICYQEEKTWYLWPMAGYQHQLLPIAEYINIRYIHIHVLSYVCNSPCTALTFCKWFMFKLKAEPARSSQPSLQIEEHGNQHSWHRSLLVSEGISLKARSSQIDSNLT